MDQELKQRLIGAAVVTALAAIFIPMLFDDPVDSSGQTVSEMTIPEPPASPENSASSKLPSNAADVENAPHTGIIAGQGQTASNAPSASNLNAEDSERVEPDLQESEIDYEPPVEMDPNLEQQLDQAAEGELITEPAQKPVGTGTDDSDTQPAAEDDLENEPAKTATLAETPSATAQSNTEKTPEPLKTPAKPDVKPASENQVQKKPVTVAKADTNFERWSVQTGFFSKKENAVSQWEKLRRLGYPATLNPENTAKGMRYRVKVGPELSKQRAIELKGRLAQQNFDAILVGE